ncbi:MAG: polyamine aminopropyltransferase [Candidatus Nealsonbacteria bacterium]
MPISKKKWFCEKLLPGKRKKTIKHCFSIDKLIFKGKTKFQNVLIFDNNLYGRILFLDGINQLSQKDEFIYHEMITHPVLFFHPNPKNILIIGGGDGGTLREVLKHPVKKIDLVELDKKIIEISKEYLKFVCKNSFSDKKVKIHNIGVERFIRDYIYYYDLVIVDCTNPEPKGLSSELYSTEFYKQVSRALKKDGIIITLGASFLDFRSFIKNTFKRLKKVFPNTSVYKFTIPSYHCGEYSFIAGSKKINLKNINFKEIEKKFKKISKKHKFKYYSPEIHKSSMILPKNWQL